MNMSTYVTVSGDMWDKIAHDQMGSERYTDQLIWANLAYRDVYVFPAGVTLVIPETPEETAERAALRQEYLNSVMGNLRRELDNTWIVDEHGNKRKLTPGKKTMS